MLKEENDNFNCPPVVDSRDRKTSQYDRINSTNNCPPVVDSRSQIPRDRCNKLNREQLSSTKNKPTSKDQLSTDGGQSPDQR